MITWTMVIQLLSNKRNNAFDYIVNETEISINQLIDYNKYELSSQSHLYGSSYTDKWPLV